MSPKLTVSRTVGPWGPVLAGFVDRKLAVLVPVKRRNIARWLSQSVTRRDRGRVSAAMEGGAS